MIKASMVKELRDRTGAGMLDCKKALEENNGDIDKAVDYLREKGILKAEKKSGRIAAEGIITGKVEGNVGVMLEVNSETDFVGKNQEFVDFSQKLLDIIIKNNPKDVDELKKQELGSQTVEETLTGLIAKIGENMTIRRFERVESDNLVNVYIHGSRIGALVELKDGSEQVAKDVAMQIVAIAPKYISREDVEEDVLNHEKQVLRQQALNEGKPEAIVDKMITGRLNKFFEEICLLDQTFIKDSDLKVGKYLKDAKVVKFVRYELGEGLEKREENFAEEVAKQVNQS